MIEIRQKIVGKVVGLWWCVITTMLCASFISCATDENELNREILVSTVWRSNSFPVDESRILNLSVDTETKNTDLLYVFDENGSMSVYPVADEVCEPIEKLRYIYSPQRAEMVIEKYGVFKVSHIEVESIVLEGTRGRIDLYFYAGEDMIPSDNN